MRRLALAILVLSGCSSAAEVAADTTDSGVAPEVAVDVGPEVFADAAPEVAPPVNVPGKQLVRKTLEGIEREFIVYVPDKARDKRVPVVFMLHGTSGDGEKFFNISGWKQKADAEGFIAVFPSSLTYCIKEDENRDGDFDDPGERKVTTKWAAGNLGEPTRIPLCTPAEIAMLPPATRALADHPLKDDVAFFRLMLDTLRDGYATDSKRVYVSGFSNGGQMSARLSVELSDRFAAAAAHAGHLAHAAPPPARPITVLYSIGNVDDALTAGGAPATLVESTVTTPSFAEIAKNFLAAGKLENKYVFDLPRSGIARWTYSTSLAGGDNRLLALLIENCAHEYPNGTNHPLVMADLLWDLFKTQKLP